MAQPNYIVFDFETGGLDPNSHQITEVGMLVCNGVTLKTIATYQTYVKAYSSDLRIDPVALQKSGVSMTDVMSGKEGKVVVREMIAFAKQHTPRGFSAKPVLVGHNVMGFDRHFAEKLFTLHGKDLYGTFSKELIDTLPLARLIWGDSKDDVTAMRLDIVCGKAGIKLTNAHSALNDVRANHKLFQYMTALMRGNLGKGQLVQDNEPTHMHRPFKM